MLLRARAIETGCFVLAPAQTGFHTEQHGKGRRTFGHSLVITPWGEVRADAGTAPGVTLADLDLAEVTRARARIPSPVSYTHLDVYKRQRLHQPPHRIIRPMQRQRMDPQVLRALLQRQHLIIRHTAPIRPYLRKTRHHNRICKHSVNPKQTILHLEHRLFLQEHGGGAGAVQIKGAAVGQGRWGCHGARP